MSVVKNHLFLDGVEAREFSVTKFSIRSNMDIPFCWSQTAQTLLLSNPFFTHLFAHLWLLKGELASTGNWHRLP